MKSIMFAGTASGVGKSLLTAGYCRLFRRMGMKTAPFKAQNMSLNGGIVDGSLQMSRAQMLQAEAAGVYPDPRMNPILLLPVGDSRSVLIRMGREAGVFSAKDYYAMKEENFKIVTEAYDSLAAEYDLIVLEGAGSPAEINLQREDIVNMRMADYAKAPVMLVGDIARGGVFAALKGTIDLVQDEYRPLIKGMLINKFRGDLSILAPGLAQIESLTGRAMMGVIPWFSHNLEEEDSLGENRPPVAIDAQSGTAPVRIGILELPGMMGYTLYFALRAYRGLAVTDVRHRWDLENLDLLIVPESADFERSLTHLHNLSIVEELTRFSRSKCAVAAMGNASQILHELGIVPNKEFRSSDALNHPQNAQILLDMSAKSYMVSDNPAENISRDLDALADLLERHTDVSKMMELMLSQ